MYKNKIFFAKGWFCFVCRYKIIQSSDYDDTRLITGENLCRQRSKKLAHLSLKHISLLGVVRQKLKPSKKSQKKKKKNTERVNEFILDQAAVDEVEELDSTDYTDTDVD